MKVKQIVWLLCTMSVFLLGGCGKGEDVKEQIVVEREEEAEDLFVTVKVAFGNVLKSEKIDCVYTPTVRKDIAFSLADKLITGVFVKEGDIVQKGDLLITLDVDDMEEQLDSLKHELASLKLSLQQSREMKEFDLKSAERLYSYTAMSEKDKENLEEQKKSIEENYAYTIQDLEDSIQIKSRLYEKYSTELEEGQIFADMDGEVTYMRERLENSMTVADEKILTLSDLDSCYFVADDVTFKEYFKEGETYFVNYSLTGQAGVCEVTPEAVSEWTDEMRFKLSNDEFIDTGMSGSITIELEQKQNVLCVPTQALHESGKEYFVYVLEGEMRTMRYVKIGLMGSEMTEITEGLEEGETVIIK